MDLTEDMVARGQQLAQEHGFGNVEFRQGDCPPLWEEKVREKQVKLQAYLESFGWRALDAE